MEYNGSTQIGCNNNEWLYEWLLLALKHIIDGSLLFGETIWINALAAEQYEFSGFYERKQVLRIVPECNLFCKIVSNFPFNIFIVIMDNK